MAKYSNTSLILPTDPLYPAASVSLGAKSPRHPIAIAYPTTSRAIAATVTCAFESNVPMNIRNSGYSFQGNSIQSNHLVIDVSKTCDGSNPESTPSVDRENMTLTLTAGCVHADILSALYVNNITGHFAVTGGMPLVGYIGWAMGGGFGNVTPYAGLGCDQFLSWRLVLYNGTSIEVNNQTHPSLFRALCGGGINVGVITSATIQLTAHPDLQVEPQPTGPPPAYTRIILSYPRKKLPIVLNRLQMLLTSSHNHSRIRIGGHGPTIRPGGSPNTLHHFCLLYLGPAPQATHFLSEFQLLAPELFDTDPPRKWYQPIATPAFPSTLPQLALLQHAVAIRPTLSLLATYPYANIILSQTSTYPEAMAAMILVDSLAMDQDGMCRALERMGGMCSSAKLPHFGSKTTTDIILKDLMGDRQSVLFDSAVSTRLLKAGNEYRRKFAPGVIIDNVLGVGIWENVLRVIEEHQCSLMIPHLLGGRVRLSEEGSLGRAFSWANGTFVIGIVSNVDHGGEDDSLETDKDLRDRDRKHQWMCFDELNRALHASRGQPTLIREGEEITSPTPAPAPIQAYYNYLGEALPGTNAGTHDVAQAVFEYFSADARLLIEHAKLQYDPHSFFT
jgi:hypothetical protein